MSECDVSVSVIVPVYNESENISGLLDCLACFVRQCEVIFVDGGSGDDTCRLIDEWICRQDSAAVLLRSPENGRANQMNFGAFKACGDVLWFVHADSRLPNDAIIRLREVIGRGFEFGCFRIRFDSRHFLMLYNAFMSNLRVLLRRIAFGDQGIFITKELFNHLGGFRPLPLMEDYQLSMDVRNAGIALGVADAVIVTSERRYLVRGRIRTMLLMQRLQHRYRRGDSIEEIAKEYRDNK